MSSFQTLTHIHQLVGVPQPVSGELPVDYTHRIGQWYLSFERLDKELGQFFTPPSIARFMALQTPTQADTLHVLDPGAGIGILSCALCEVVNNDLEVEAYEVDAKLVPYLDLCLSYAKIWMRSRGLSLNYSVIQEDFILTNASALHNSCLSSFDVVISNPPYFKISKADLRAQAVEQIVHGQPNIYALFMAVSSAMLRLGGHGVYITPRSYAAGPYFARFRDYLFSLARPRVFHLFESRRDVFDEVLQESLITIIERSTEERNVVISSSASRVDFSNLARRTKPLAEILGKDGVLYLPLSEQDDVIATLLRSWTGRLHSYGMAVSTGPVVPFRAKELVSAAGQVPGTHAPLLWLQNVTRMRWEWPVHHKGQYLALDGGEKLFLPNQNYVLLRRFSAKEEQQRLVAAPYLAEIETPIIGLENHLNYIYRPQGQLTDKETYGLAALLNSRLMDLYVRIFSGNTQVSATELRNLPLPPLEVITKLGELVVHAPGRIDDLLTETLKAHV